MKAPFWIGIAVLVVGIVSLVVPVRHNQRAGFNAGGMSAGVEISHEEKLSPWMSAVMILGGAGTMAAGKKKS